MTEGIYKADTYFLSVNGKEYSGRFADLTKDTVFEGVDPQMIFGLMITGSVGYKFFDGKWKSSFGGSWTSPPVPNKYTIEGDKLILTHYSGKVEATFTINGDELSSTGSENGVTVGFTLALEK